jgi:small-conductance mechanosensitive channel
MPDNPTGYLQDKIADVSKMLSFAPPLAVAALVLIGVVVVALAADLAVRVVLHRALRNRRPFLLATLDASKPPMRLALILLALAVALPAVPLGSETRAGFGQILLVAAILLIGWIALTALNIGADFYLRNFGLDARDNELARQHITQVRVLLRVMDVIVMLVTAGFALMTFDTVRQYGVSLFASAGVAGLVAGLAARPVLSNLFASIQLAMTQPIRIEDAVTVENEYGWVEEITWSYVVVRLWDLRRLVVPLSYFIEKPFYNWTRKTAANIGTVVFFVDYSTPIDMIRQKAAEIVTSATKATGEVTNVLIANARPDCIEVRIFIRTISAGMSNDLAAELRERLIDYLRREHPYALPRQRQETVAPPAPGA